jgi:formylglycine-generating enzyme
VKAIVSLVLFTALALLAFAHFDVRSAQADTFGSGANTFDIQFVTIGNPGNAADTTGNPNPAGSVPYTYRMDKFEISEQMIDKANTLGGLNITKDTRGADKPATSVSWNEAARFVNWLDTSTGSQPAYKFAVQPGEVGYDANANIDLWTIGDAGYNPNNLYRNSLARYFLPSVDEWCKAAYYDPTSGVYYDYPTGSNSAPTPVASGTGAGTAVYNGQIGPANITLAGGLSPYGTMGQGGNVYEWEETDFDQLNGPTDSSSARGVRGGSWGASSSALSSSFRFGINNPSLENFNFGFRVASIPEPASLTLSVAGMMALVLWSGRKQFRQSGAPSGNSSKDPTKPIRKA